MNEQIMIVIFIAALVIGVAIGTNVYRVFVVREGFAGLLYRKGKFVELLPAGQHIRWGRKLALTTVDLRKTIMSVTGQEVLTADNIGVKLSLLVAYKVTDPDKAMNDTQNWPTDLYHAAQLATRAVVSGIALEALLGQRLDIGAQLLARVQADAVKIGINVTGVEIKDVTFAADLKRAFADVLKAKQEGQAALECARGESAALRNLANAARLLDGNPALQNLRLMQSLATAQKAGNTLVLGVPGEFAPLKPTNTEAPAKTDAPD